MKIKTADLFFTCNEGSFVTEGIQFFQAGGDECPYTHVALITQWPWIISADASGLQHREIVNEELWSFRVLTCPTLTDEQREEIIRSAFKDVERGLRYDFYTIGKLALHLPVQIDESVVYCAEHVYVKYLKKGVELLKRGPCFVTPRDLFHCGLLEEITP